MSRGIFRGSEFCSFPFCGGRVVIGFYRRRRSKSLSPSLSLSYSFPFPLSLPLSLYLPPSLSASRFLKNARKHTPLQTPFQHGKTTFLRSLSWMGLSLKNAKGTWIATSKTTLQGHFDLPTLVTWTWLLDLVWGRGNRRVYTFGLY